MLLWQSGTAFSWAAGNGRTEAIRFLEDAVVNVGTLTFLRSLWLKTVLMLAI
jgi:hypothetical protein